jgi:hypothetical protein
MIRPAAFGFNDETSRTNPFQTESHYRIDEVQRLAVSEFDAAVRAIREAGVDVIVAEDQPLPRTPDAVFPNNWISMHHDGTVVLYPMQAPNRRLERRDDVIDELTTRHGFDVRRIIDLAPNADQGRYLEGTGSMVFDHRCRVTYACLSSRTDLGMLYEAQELLGYESVAFRATDQTGLDVYHTNVVMSIGEQFAIICTDAIVEPAAPLLDRLRRTDREVIELTYAQMSAFAANVLELRRADGDGVLVVSERGWNALQPEQRLVLSRHTQVVDAVIPTIESVGGGSIRCMIAEIFLPCRGRAQTI